MKDFVKIQSRIAVALLLLTVTLLPVNAFFWWSEKEGDIILPVHRQVLVNECYQFSAYDFHGKESLTRITLTTLPDPNLGVLFMGDKPILQGESIDVSALTGLVYHAENVVGTTTFEIKPTFTDGVDADTVIITIDVLTIPNEAPLAKDMELFTYQNIDITCYFDAIDSEGDFLTFQIVDPPARGAATLAEDGSSSFVYSPYENKTGRDTFQYIATDSSGNVSNEGTVTIRIEKNKSNVTYSDMNGHPAHKSAISLAESGVLVGECIGNTYLFHPDEPVSRDEFLSLAMSVAEMMPIPETVQTGFYDDDSIPTWSKGYVSSALLCGVIQGSWDENGRPIFDANSVITMGEASVILDNLLSIDEIDDTSSDHWASQASANLSAVGVSTSNQLALPSGLNRGEVAELLDGALALMNEKEKDWLNW